MYATLCNRGTEEKVAIIFAVAYTITSFSLLTAGLVCFNTGAWISDDDVCTSVYISGMFLTFLVGASIYMYFIKLLVDYFTSRAPAPAPAPATTTVSVKKNPARIASRVLSV